MNRVFYVCFIFFLIFISCNNDDDSDPQIDEANYYALKIGNNWKYEYFKRISQTDEFETEGVVEEVLITETSVINGETFFTFQSTTTGNDNGNSIYPENGITLNYKRDSLGYLIDSNYSILFSSDNLNDYLISENIWGDLYGVLKEETESIDVGAGSFIANRNEIYALLAPNGDISPGRDNKYYTEEIGEIYRKYSSANNPEHNWEKRLLDFEIIN